MGKPPWLNFVESIYNNGFSNELVEEFLKFFHQFNIVFHKGEKFLQVNSLVINFEQERSKSGSFYTTNASFQSVLPILEYKDSFNTFKIMGDTVKISEPCIGMFFIDDVNNQLISHPLIIRKCSGEWDWQNANDDLSLHVNYWNKVILNNPKYEKLIQTALTRTDKCGKHEEEAYKAIPRGRISPHFNDEGEEYFDFILEIDINFQSDNDWINRIKNEFKLNNFKVKVKAGNAFHYDYKNVV